MRPLVPIFALVLGAGLSLGCSSSDEPGSTEGGIDPKTGLARCASDPSKRTTEPCVDEKGAVLCMANSGYRRRRARDVQPGSDAKGMLLHYGPKNYDDRPRSLSTRLPAGGEEENCVIAHTPNTTEVSWTNYNGRMRPNSHHLIVTMLTARTGRIRTARSLCDWQPSGHALAARFAGSADRRIGRRSRCSARTG